MAQATSCFLWSEHVFTIKRTNIHCQGRESEVGASPVPAQRGGLYVLERERVCVLCLCERKTVSERARQARAPLLAAPRFFFFFFFFEPRIEWYRRRWALNTSPPRNRLTFLRSSRAHDPTYKSQIRFLVLLGAFLSIWRSHHGTFLRPTSTQW